MVTSNFLKVGVLLVTFSSVLVSASIGSSSEPDWSIAKADLQQELYTYEPLSSLEQRARDYRSIIPTPMTQAFRGNNKGPPRNGGLVQLQMQPPNNFPKIAKFLVQDKKMPFHQSLKKGYIGPIYEHHQPQQYQSTTPTSHPHLHPVAQPSHSQLYFIQPPQQLHAGYLPASSPSPSPPVINNNNIPNPSATHLPKLQQVSGGYQNSNPHQYQHHANTSNTYFGGGEPGETQSIIWPKELDQGLVTHGEETQLRFIVHKSGDEEEIKKALSQDGDERGQEVKFVEGPALRIQRHQKVYLPPKKKTVVYILLKEPQILTDVEVVGPTEEPVPEVFITYQKADGHVKTKHYTPEHVKGDKTLKQLHSDLISKKSEEELQQNHNVNPSPVPTSGGYSYVRNSLNSNNNNHDYNTNHVAKKRSHPEIVKAEPTQAAKKVEE